MRYLLLFFLLFSVFQSFGQFLTVQDSWALPMDAPVELSAGFGDLRPNHFHMGLDIRTGGKINLPIYACADGFVSRIRVSSVGYGWVLYVQHPNGYTTVYAHCTRFAERIQNLYLDSTAARLNNEIDLILPAQILPVKRGELIAFSGNTGGSTGPHLHFELRDTKTEHALNPFLHGFQISDKATPVLKGIRVYALDDKGFAVPNKVLNVVLTAKTHQAELPPGFLAEGQLIGVALEMEDYFVSAGRTYGVFASEILAEGQEPSAIEFDEINFDHSRYINTHHDAAYARSSKRKFQKLFRSRTNPLTIYPYEGLGTFEIGAKDSLLCQLMLRDVNGNETQHTLLLINPHEKTPQVSFYNGTTHWLPEASYVYQQGPWSIAIDSFTFYEPTLKKLNFQAKSIGNSSLLLQNPIEISYRFDSGSAAQKYCITMNGSALPGKLEDGVLRATTKSMGIWGLKQDLVAPVIKENVLNKLDSTSTGKFYWSVSDDFSGLAYYACYQNETWVPAYYDAKNKQIGAQFKVPFQENERIVILVRDAVGNETKKEWKVPMKPQVEVSTQPSE
jgi:hypothetical protein